MELRHIQIRGHAPSSAASSNLGCAMCGKLELRFRIRSLQVAVWPSLPHLCRRNMLARVIQCGDCMPWSQVRGSGEGDAPPAGSCVQWRQQLR